MEEQFHCPSKSSTLRTDTFSDQKASREDEIRRIEDAGGWVMSHQEINLAKLYRLSPGRNDIICD